MTQSVTRYHALFESVRSRRRRPEVYKGLDALWSVGALRLKQRRASVPRLRKQAELIDGESASWRSMSDAALDVSLGELREQFRRGRADEPTVRRGLAAVREVARRQTGQEAYVVQLMGAMGLYHGRVVEMMTGEGKTLTGSLVAPLLAWRHRSVHVFTVNDYLAARDAESRATIYKRCGCSVGSITQQTEQNERYNVYARSIVYGTPKQITADYLRDQLRLGRLETPWAGRKLLSGGVDGGGGSGAGPMVPGLQCALVDEADAVLIDEGVVPLIIARARREDEMGAVYREAAGIAEKLEEGRDFRMDLLRRKATLTSRGLDRALQLADTMQSPIWRAKRRGEELVKQALVAAHCYKRGHQYEIVDGQVVIVDEYTGRFLPDRSWEHGLHQAVEAKEKLEVTADRETLARISFQRFFRMYPFLCGMTGTIAEASGELERVYERRVTMIPTNRPVVRDDRAVRVFRDAESKWSAVVASIEEEHKLGRPVLVGTRSIEASELIAERLAARGLACRVLNANFDKDEADLIAQAGHGGRLEARITVATNMAGRGTDILLDRAAREAGGLHVLLTEMHAALRIDRQFIGRSGRQGDPGSSQVFVSLDDELIRHHAPRAGSALRARAGGPEFLGTARTRALVVFRHAQRSAGRRQRSQRAEVLRQDDWIERYMPGR